MQLDHTCCYIIMFYQMIQAGHEGFIIDPNGRSFTGKLGPDLKLCGKVSIMIACTCTNESLKICLFFIKTCVKDILNCTILDLFYYP